MVDLGDRVTVQRRREGRVVHEIGVVTRSDSWNGIWVGTGGARGGSWKELPLAEFVRDGHWTDGPPAPRSRRGEALGALAGLAVAGAFALWLVARAVARI